MTTTSKRIYDHIGSSPHPSKRIKLQDMEPFAMMPPHGLDFNSYLGGSLPDVSVTTSVQYDFSDFNTAPTAVSTAAAHAPESSDTVAYPFFEFLGTGGGDVGLFPQTTTPMPPTSSRQQEEQLRHFGGDGCGGVNSTIGSSVASSSVGGSQSLLQSKATSRLLDSSHSAGQHAAPPSLSGSNDNTPTEKDNDNEPAGISSHDQDNTNIHDSNLNNSEINNISTHQNHHNSHVHHNSNTEQNSEGPGSSSTTDEEDSETSRRQADRAARNRESSRRAREKAKGRLKALEAEVLLLRDHCRRYKVQIDSIAQQAARGQCGMCGCVIAPAGAGAGAPGLGPARHAQLGHAAQGFIQQTPDQGHALLNVHRQ